MDGRGRYLDSISIERLWSSLKYEAVYLAVGPDAERVVGSWFAFYNELRPHSALGGRTPDEVYWGGRAVHVRHQLPLFARVRAYTCTPKHQTGLSLVELAFAWA